MIKNVLFLVSFFPYRLSDHVDDKTKLPILIFPEGELFKLSGTNSFTLDFNFYLVFIKGSYLTIISNLQAPA